MFKMAGAGVLLVGALYMSGLFDSGYSRVVSKPQAQVMAALDDLDIRKAPGSPGTDPSRAGGVTPTFRLEKTADSMTWTVMSGDKVATRMIATFEPVDGGKQTRVRAHVERGDAPDDYVSPAFRSKALTMSLFSMTLESELNALVTPPGSWNAGCDDIMRRFESENEAAGMAGRPDNLNAAIGNTAKTVMRMHAVDGQLRADGCDPEHRVAASDMTEAPPQPGVSFEPGKPMIDPSRSAR